MSSHFARRVEAGIKSGTVNPRGHLNIKPLDLPCDHLLASGDEAYAWTYVTVAKDGGKVATRDGLRVGQLDGLTATVAGTGETVTGANRRAVLTALLLAHNAHVNATNA